MVRQSLHCSVFLGLSTGWCAGISIAASSYRFLTLWLAAAIQTRGDLEEFESVMQTQEVVEGLHNFQELSQPPSVYTKLCKHGKSALLLLQPVKKYS